MNNIMIDLETLSTRVNGVILSISAVRFDIKTGESGGFFHENINLIQSIRQGFVIDQSTFDWWQQQSDVAKALGFKINAKGAQEVISRFVYWTGNKDPNSIVWGNSARFDLGMLIYHMEKFNLKIPWKYYNERCHRTAVYVLDKEWDIPFEGVPHYGIDDCKHQIKILTS